MLYLVTMRLCSLMLAGYFLFVNENNYIYKGLGLIFLGVYIIIFNKMQKERSEYIEWTGSDDPIN